MVASHYHTKLIAEGAWGKVRAIYDTNGICRTEDFLNDEMEKIKLGKNKGTAFDLCMEAFEELARCGALPPKRFKGEPDGFTAIRLVIQNRQIRFPCFQDDNCWLITHGFFKPGAQKKLGQWPTEELNRAKRLRTEYFTRKALRNT